MTNLVGQSQLGVDHMLKLVAGVLKLDPVQVGPVSLLLKRVIHVPSGVLLSGVQALADLNRSNKISKCGPKIKHFISLCTS